MKSRVIKNNSKNGFSLIELLIAMTIGLFLLAGIATSYLSSKKASMNRNQTSALEDNGRLALEVLTRSLEHTGYAPNILSNKPFIVTAGDVTADICPDGTLNVVDTSIFDSAADDDVAGQDTIGVIFHGDDNVFTDCAGSKMDAVTPVGCRLLPLPALNPSPDSSKIYNSFAINNATNTLDCAGSRSASRVAVADGVENIQFLYGIDNDSDGVVDRYVNATAINASPSDNLDWEGVISIQAAVLVRSLKPVKNLSESEEFTLLDVVVTTPNDKFQRAVFSTTIFLHNNI